MDKSEIKNIVEAALMAAGRPLNIDGLLSIFGDGARPERGEIREAVHALQEEYESRGIELVEVASGFRIQVASSMSDWLSRLWQDRPQRYSRALMETLALIAYRQPITRGEIEDVRGVSVSSSIIRTLLERAWIRVVGHRDVPGRPEMFGTTKEFLDYFGLRRLDELPSLAELRDLDSLNVELDLGEPGEPPQPVPVKLVPDVAVADVVAAEEQSEQVQSISDNAKASVAEDDETSPEQPSAGDESSARA
ncbi:MAG: SMC-Scp complex subunit ScpB [Gammaproteobacteria bacterium]|nr:MAG: SMC-Scp complex subunit ScpB [Gammaproteobacteria bacterium]